jgi:hypothetical protein
MKPIKRTYFMVLGPNDVLFQRRKQIFINFDGIKLILFTFFFARGPSIKYVTQFWTMETTLITKESTYTVQYLLGGVL